MKILVIQTASIGDVILATPVLEGLHHAYPSAEIDLLLKKGMEGLFTGHPFIRHLIVWDKKSKYSDFLRILLQVRKSRYDLIINIQRFATTGLLTAFSGAKTTIGFSKNPFSFFFSKQISHRIGKGIHEVERNVSLIRPVISAGQRAEEFGSIPRPKLYPSPADEATVSSYKAIPYATVSPASLWFTKQYPAEKWVELIGTLPAKLPVYLLGSGSDVSLCDEIKTAAGRDNVSVLAGQLSFLESAALMKDARMNYTNDSAPMHLATAVDAPTSVVYCSTIPEFGFGPLSRQHWIIQTRKELRCRPCGLHGKRECPLQHFECAAGITPDQFPSLL
ncbi:MAG: glycosyltransferase family 9 protein [Bacteroidetes bacterium]|nr:glycosyltransferase family 9 protein [Bacteroidota bacterium]